MNSDLQRLGDQVRRLSRSIAAKVVVLVIIFVACPVIVYVQLKGANEERTAILLQSMQDQGRLVARALVPALRSFGGPAGPEVQKALDRLGKGSLNVKVLFRPTSAAADAGFFYVASRPAVPPGWLDDERQRLVKTGILDKLGSSCEGDLDLALRYVNPSGKLELLSSLTPVHTLAGCWVVLTSYPDVASAPISIGTPYWEVPEVRLAAAIYVAMAALVFAMFVTVWRSLRRFGALAQTIRSRGEAGHSFEALNRVPELTGVAREFDRLVDKMDTSRKLIRDAAEETAHALKTPIAVIAQSLEPLKRGLDAGNERGRRAVALIERSIERLDSLIAAARQMDETIAELIDPPREPVDLSRLLEQMVSAYREPARERGVTLDAHIAPGVSVSAGEELLETVFENLIDNALGFAPRGSAVRVRLAAEGEDAVVTVADAGPGVDPRNLERIFERYFSDRPLPPCTDGNAALRDQESAHFGMGLWIVRRNVEAVEGSVAAANGDHGGLDVTVHLRREV